MNPSIRCLESILRQWRQDRSIINLVNADIQDVQVNENLQSVVEYMALLIPCLEASIRRLKEKK